MGGVSTECVAGVCSTNGIKCSRLSCFLQPQHMQADLHGLNRHKNVPQPPPSAATAVATAIAKASATAVAQAANKCCPTQAQAIADALAIDKQVRLPSVQAWTGDVLRWDPLLQVYAHPLTCLGMRHSMNDQNAYLRTPFPEQIATATASAAADACASGGGTASASSTSIATAVVRCPARGPAVQAAKLILGLVYSS